jgi:predicted amidohydrolase YtcJ
VNKLGYAVKLHCCGDAAVRLALDSFELSNAVNDNRKLRNSVEHMDIVSDADVPRFKKFGVIASVQPAHVIMTKGIYDVRIGERSKETWNYRRLINAGVVLSIGTDSPVVDFNPFQTIYFAVTRRDLDGAQYSPNTADQALTLPEALKGYTINSAYASNMEQKVGTLEAGKYADIIVLDRNLFKVPVEELKDSRVVCTVFDGRVVYEAQ